jgi:organic radical activating enzyme
MVSGCRAFSESGSRSMDVRVESTRDNNYFYVNWWLTDHCNWNCSYCHEEIKRGRLPFPDIRHVRDFLDQTNQHALRQGKKMYIDLTGGEVTEYPHLQELLDHAHNLGAFTKIRTNASQSIKDFSSMVKVIDFITLEFHPEYTQTSHFLLCLSYAGLKKDLKVSVNLNALPTRWTEIEDIKSKITEKWPQFSITLKMLFDDPVRNTKPLAYLAEQKEKLKRQTGSLVIYSDLGDSEYSDYQSMILEDRNNFQDWSCNIGLEQIIVDAWGVIRRGHCRQGGSIGQIGNQIRFDQHTVVCKKPKCVNNFDMLATKFRLF